MSTTMLWCFGPFRLDPASGCLWRNTTLVPLRPKPFVMLAYLVAHAGQVVSKERVFDAVWPDTVVSEGLLKDYINQIRKTLGDTPRTPQYIATVPRRGYRFVAPVTMLASPPGAEAESLRHPETPGLSTNISMPLPPFPSSPPAIFVAREVELVQLHQWWTMAQQGQRQLGLIAGEEGIGKTALVDAFIAQRVADATAWIGYGQCIEQYGAGEPYLPLLEAFGRLGRAFNDTRLVDVLQQYAPNWLSQLPTLWRGTSPATISGREPGPTRERMLRELAEAVEVLTTDQPLILILEDLHWSDTSTLEWLAYIARRRQPARLCILGTYRPVDAMVREHPLRTVVLELQRHKQCQELLLRDLAPAGVAEYLLRRFAGKPSLPNLAALLHQRTDGNPLFLVTLVDDAVRRRVLQEDATGVTLAGEITEVATGVPESLRHLIEQQLEQLDPVDLELLETASAAGMIFSATVVAAGMQVAVLEVEKRCAILVRHQQFVQASSTAEWPDGTLAAQYGFRHAFYREVLYERVPVARRVQLHRQIGLRLETSYGPRVQEIAAELAMHFGQGRETQRTVQYLRQAAQNALRHSAHREAAQYYERALQTLAQLPQQHDTHALVIDIYLALRNALVPLGEFARILTLLHDAEALAQALGDVPRQGRIAAYLTRDFHMTGKHVEAVASGLRALTMAQEDAALRVTTHLYLSYAYYALGEYRRVLEVLRPEVASLTGTLTHESLGLAALPAVSTRVNMVYSLTELGEFSEGLALGHEALHIAEAVGQPFSLTQAYRGLGGLYLQQGQLDRAIPLLEQGLAICEQTELPLALPAVASYLGAAYAQAGRWSEALPWLEQAVARGAAMQLGERQTLRMVLLGTGYLHTGRSQDALLLAQDALVLAQERQERGFAAYAWRLLGEVAAHGTSPEAVTQAETNYRQAMDLASNLGMRPLLAHSALGLGTLYSRTGQGASAHTMLSLAMTLFEAMEMTSWAIQVRTNLIQIGAG